MKKKFSFTIESLIHNTERMEAPLVQGLFSHRMAEKHGQLFFSSLCRITFNDNAINRALPGAGLLEETLLMDNHWFDDGELHIYVRRKDTYLHIATAKLQDKTLEISEQYENEILERRLTRKQIEDIFNCVWANPNVLNSKPASMRPSEWD